MTDEERAAFWFGKSILMARIGNKKRRKSRSRGDWVQFRGPFGCCDDEWPDNRRKLRDKIHAQEMIYYDLD